MAGRLGLHDLLSTHVRLVPGPGAAHPADKAMTVMSSALAGGDSIDDVDVLRSGTTQQVLGHGVAAPSTVGTFLRRFTWGHARQLDRVSGEVLARAWQAGAGPGAGPFTIDWIRRSARPTGCRSRYRTRHQRAGHGDRPATAPRATPSATAIMAPSQFTSWGKRGGMYVLCARPRPLAWADGRAFVRRRRTWLRRWLITVASMRSPHPAPVSTEGPRPRDRGWGPTWPTRHLNELPSRSPRD
jgi:hypothetical protein